jgi:hypothetical protein
MGVKAVNTASGAVMLAAYILYAIGKDVPQPETFESLGSWAEFMLAFMGMAIVVMIAVNVVYHIAFSVRIAVKSQGSDDEEVCRMVSASLVEDEMGKLIDLKSMRVGYACAGIGIVLTLAVLAYGNSPILALNIMFVSLFMGMIAEGLFACRMYTGGVRHD